ncbi:hypothetical protein BKA66DRAFT_441682 [Pyrenochaeta sp. MPI-SDFR-AT-0127]|nr:hypothetical protein BKA66DRAFT_441682 [Pyrenochaeta sp. MPI-SDFR-AT-0127]
MSYHESEFHSKKQIVYNALNRNVEKTEWFLSHATAEQVAAKGASEIAGKTVVITSASPFESSQNVKAVVVDLPDLDLVRKGAADILEVSSIVDCLINNEGIYYLNATKQSRGLSFSL